MDQETSTWLEMAKTDYGVANHLFDNYYPKPLEIICYHCQQAAEKALKAIIVENGAQGGMPKLHDLSFLLNQIKNQFVVDEKIYDMADTLTPYGVVVRYPSELFIEEHHAKNALKYAKEILDWTESVLEINNDEE